MRQAGVVILAWLAVLGGGARVGAETVAERFLREAPAGWAKLEEMESHLAFRVHVTDKALLQKTGKARPKEFDYRWQRRPGC